MFCERCVQTLAPTHSGGRSTLDYKTVDEMIRYLQNNIPAAQSALFAIERNDWRPFFAKAKEIQEAFNSKVLYPTKEERDQAWVRFSDLRNLMHERANTERTRFREQSEEHRNEILRHVKNAGYSSLTDAVFFFDPTTVEDMKRASQTVSEGGQMLSRHKERMLKEHKEECFARFQELRSEQDVFWEKYKRHRATKQAEHESRMREVADRIKGNIRKNHEQLSKAEAALERVLENIASNEERLATARGEEFAERVSGWIEEGREKARSITESISRINEWIREEETRLRDIEAKL